jgi:hypothetical protein
MGAHIFVDNSNIFGGAQRAANTHEPGAVWMSVRLYYRNFFRLIEHGHQPETRELAGSVPPGNEALWDYAREGGYNTDLLEKIEEDDGNLAEQGVDEMLHLKIANSLLDCSPPQTLVLATGDGNVSDFGTSFVQQARRALNQGWDVEVWSWKEQLSGRYERIRVPDGRSLNVNLLDGYYKQITFIDGGKYEISGSNVMVEDRVVNDLKIGKEV